MKYKMEVERDLSDFDKNVMNLFEVCENIMKSSDERSVFNKKNPITTRLRAYTRIYKQMHPEEHVVYFENIFKNNRRMIMLGPQRDAWLRDNNITITFGEDCGKRTGIKFHISAIYSTACKLRDEVEEEIEGLPGITKPETGYPEAFLLGLYKVFSSIVESEADKTKLDKHTGELGDTVKTNSSDPLSGMMNMATNMVEKMTGQKIPGDKLPGGNDITKMMSQMVNNPQTKNMIGNMMEGMKNTDGLGGIVSQLMNGLGGGNPESTEPKALEEQPIEEGDVNDEFDD